MVVLVLAPPYRIGVALFQLEPRTLLADGNDGFIDGNGEANLGRCDGTLGEGPIPVLPSFPGVGGIAAVDARLDRLEIAFARVQGDCLGEARLHRQAKLQELDRARIQKLRHGTAAAPFCRRGDYCSVTDAAGDLAGLLQLGERGPHDIARCAELLRELALGRQTLARLDAPLVDLTLEDGNELVGKAARTHSAAR